MIPNEKRKTRIEFDLHHCQLPESVLEKMRENLDAISPQLGHFPLADFHVLIERNNRSNGYSVKVALVLPGDTLVGTAQDPAVHVAFEQCLMGLEENLRAYKERMGQVPERQKQEKGTHHEVEPNPPPDPAAIDKTVRDADYAAFRTATFGYEEPVRKRVGRWIERYPEVNGQIGHGLEVEDLVEEVFLLAFEGYESRPMDIRFGDWLEALIDPAVKALQQHRDEELENINLVRSAREAEQGSGAV